MGKRFGIAIAGLVFAGVSFAQGSGSQIRGGSDSITQKSPPQRVDTKPCESLRDEARKRCIKEAIDKTESTRRSGPESTGMGSGAGGGSPPR